MGFQKHRWKGRRGATTVETLLMTPLYFLFVFGLLQLGQLMTALLVVNYAAGAIARQAVADNIRGDRAYPEILKRLMIAGMKNPSAMAKPKDGMLADVNVDACVEVGAFPFVSQVAAKSIAPGSSSNCDGVNIIAFNRSGTGSFVLQAKAKARLNMRG